jgi:hypothetical protein
MTTAGARHQAVRPAAFEHLRGLFAAVAVPGPTRTGQSGGGEDPVPALDGVASISRNSSALPGV